MARTVISVLDEDKLSYPSSAYAYGTVSAITGKVKLTTFSVGSTYEMCVVPADATVIGGHLTAENCDGHATVSSKTFALDLGWQADPNGFGEFGAFRNDKARGGTIEPIIHNQIGGVLASDGPKTFITDTIIEISVRVRQASSSGITTPLVTVLLFCLRS